jgi:hypothetical protein
MFPSLSPDIVHALIAAAVVLFVARLHLQGTRIPLVSDILDRILRASPKAKAQVVALPAVAKRTKVSPHSEALEALLDQIASAPKDPTVEKTTEGKVVVTFPNAEVK